MTHDLKNCQLLQHSNLVDIRDHLRNIRDQVNRLLDSLDVQKEAANKRELGKAHVKFVKNLLYVYN